MKIIKYYYQENKYSFLFSHYLFIIMYLLNYMYAMESLVTSVNAASL